MSTGNRPVRFRLIFDAARCDGHGMCSLRFPERITLDYWGYAMCDPEPFEETSLKRKATVAARCCPEGALRVVEVRPEGEKATPV